MLPPGESKSILETTLLVSQEPLTPHQLGKLFDEELGAETLRGDWSERGIELLCVAGCLRFQNWLACQKYLVV